MSTKVADAGTEKGLPAMERGVHVLVGVQVMVEVKSDDPNEFDARRYALVRELAGRERTNDVTGPVRVDTNQFEETAGVCR